VKVANRLPPGYEQHTADKERVDRIDDCWKWSVCSQQHIS